jgi:hypothetical protein
MARKFSPSRLIRLSAGTAPKLRSALRLSKICDYLADKLCIFMLSKVETNGQEESVQGFEVRAYIGKGCVEIRHKVRTRTTGHRLKA